MKVLEVKRGLTSAVIEVTGDLHVVPGKKYCLENGHEGCEKVPTPTIYGICGDILSSGYPSWEEVSQAELVKIVITSNDLKTENLGEDGGIVYLPNETPDSLLISPAEHLTLMPEVVIKGRKTGDIVRYTFETKYAGIRITVHMVLTFQGEV